MGRSRKPCLRCGGPKEPGARRRYCDACRVLVAEVNRASVRQRAARWYRENHERGKAKRREWALAHRSTGRTREWRRKNPERASAIRRRSVMRYRARKLAAHVEDVDPRIVYERDEGICGICGEAVDLAEFEVDHIVPLAAGGEHSYWNVQVAHLGCNRAKGAKVPDDLTEKVVVNNVSR